MPSDLNDLDQKLEEALHKHDITPAQARDAENMSVGMKAGTELVGCVIAGAGLGYLLDSWLGTKPAFLIIMLILGVIAGFVNVWRVTQNIGTNIGYSQLHKTKKPVKTAPDKGESK